MGTRQICVNAALKHGYSKPKCHNLQDVQLIFVSVPKNCTNKLQNFLQTRIMVDGAKFNSHDSGSHFKKSTFQNGYWKKNSYIFVTGLKLQVTLSMPSLHRYTLNGIKISTFLKKKSRGMRLNLSRTKLNVHVFHQTKTFTQLLIQ